MKSKVFLALGALAPIAASACSEAPVDPGPQGKLSVAVTPLSLVDVTDAFYTLRVLNGDGDKVWEQQHLQSTRYGDGKGALSYVGTCDADANDNVVQLEIEKLVGTNGQDVPAADWQNPAPSTRPLAITVTCRENADVPVVFNLTVMRTARQGFFDIVVSFEDVFCSAKFDCADKNGDDLELLFPADGGERATSVVLGFACTAGEGQDTWLHMSDVAVECGTAPNITTYWMSPDVERAGNAGPVLPVFFQTAVYNGQEDLPGLDKCYWNMAFGVNEGQGAANCRLVASGTASSSAFGPTGQSPANTIWPYVSFDIPLTDGAGQVACGQNPLNGGGSHVTTRYTDFGGSRFPHTWECGSEPPTTNRIACDGAIDGVEASFTETPDGIAVAFGNSLPDPDSPRYQLPEGLGLQLTGDCCMNPCCTTGP